MTILEKFEESYETYGFFNICAGNKYVWAAEEVFGMFTYDNKMSELFVKEIFEVLDVIINRTNYEYINKNEDSYIKYLRVCLFLDRLCWLEWGSSIRGAWLDSDNVRFDDAKKDIIKGVPYTPDNLVMLMNFVEEKENGQ